MTAGRAAQVHLSFGAHLIGNEVAQFIAGLLTGFQALLVHPVPQLVHQFDGHFTAHIGQNELFFQLIVKIIIDLAAGEGIHNVAPEARAGLFEAVFHLIFFFFAKSKEAHFRSSLLRFAVVQPLSRWLAPASSPGRGASGVSSKLYPTCQGLSY